MSVMPGIPAVEGKNSTWEEGSPSFRSDRTAYRYGRWFGESSVSVPEKTTGHSFLDRRSRRIFWDRPSTPPISVRSVPTTREVSLAGDDSEVGECGASRGAILTGPSGCMIVLIGSTDA